MQTLTIPLVSILIEVNGDDHDDDHYDHDDHDYHDDHDDDHDDGSRQGLQTLSILLASILVDITSALKVKTFLLCDRNSVTIYMFV